MTDRTTAKSKWLMVLSMLYVMVLIATQLLVHKIFYFFNIYFSVAVLVFPISFTISDIVTEVFGYEISRYLLWSGLAVTFVFCTLTITLVHLPIPSNIHHQHDYQVIFDPMLRSYLACFIATMTGGVVNIYCISQWKVLLRGRYFWLRSIGSTFIGAFVFTIIADPLTFIGLLPLNEIATIALCCYIIKILYACILAPPATFCVNLLKQGTTQEEPISKTINPFAEFADTHSTPKI